MENMTSEHQQKLSEAFKQIGVAFDSFVTALAVCCEKIADLEIIRMYSEKNISKLRKRKRYERMMARRKNVS